MVLRHVIAETGRVAPMAGGINEGIEHVLTLFVAMVTIESLVNTPVDCLTMDEAFRVYVDLLSRKLFRNRV